MPMIQGLSASSGGNAFCIVDAEGTPRAVTAANVSAWLAANPGATNAELAAYLDGQVATLWPGKVDDVYIHVYEQEPLLVGIVVQQTGLPAPIWE